MNRDVAMTHLLMEAAPTRAREFILIATRRRLRACAGAWLRDVVAVSNKRNATARRLSCVNATVTPAQDQSAQRSRAAIAPPRFVFSKPTLQIQACDAMAARLCISPRKQTMSISSRGSLVAAPVRESSIPRSRAIDLAAGCRPRNAPPKISATARLLLLQGSDLTVRLRRLGNEARVRELVAADPTLLHQISTFGGGLVTLAVNHRQPEMVRLLLDLAPTSTNACSSPKRKNRRKVGACLCGMPRSREISKSRHCC